MPLEGLANRPDDHGDRFRQGLGFGEHARHRMLHRLAIFRLHPLGDVLDDADEIERLARRVSYQRYRPLYPEVGAILAPVQPFRRKGSDFAFQHRLAVSRLIRSHVVRMNELIGVHSRELFLRMAEHLAELRIHVQDAVVLDRGMHDADRRVVERRAVALLRLLALGDVANDDRGAHDLSGLVLDG